MKLGVAEPTSSTSNGGTVCKTAQLGACAVDYALYGGTVCKTAQLKEHAQLTMLYLFLTYFLKGIVLHHHTANKANTCFKTH